MQQGALNTNRIAFAALVLELSMVPKIKAYYEGIPLTAEGSSTIEDIDMETIGSIEIIKGPNSTSFGSGLGVINLFAREIPMDEFH
jgi:iron complex outermembrane receptor protein